MERPRLAFPFEQLRELLMDQHTTIAVVTLSMEPAPEVAEGETVEARYLNLDQDLRAQFTRTLLRTLRAVSRRELEAHEAGWVSIDEAVGVADVEILEGPVRPAVLAALGNEPAGDLPVLPRPETDDDADAEDRSVGAYTIVIRRGTDRALIFRRRDPVERPSRNRFTAVLDGDRLSKTERTYIFDGGADVIEYDNRVAIVNSRAFEELFSNEALRREGARRAVDVLAAQVPLANRDALDEVLEADSRFAGRLRALDRRGQLAALDMTALERATERFGIRERLIQNDGLVFVRPWRFIWLSVLEDSLVESSGTARPYLARIKAEWVRREVRCVEVDATGSPAALVGDWGRVSVDNAIQELRYVSATYYADLPDTRVELEVSRDDGPARLVARTADGQSDRFAELPHCS
jgi:hypothetical protein